MVAASRSVGSSLSGSWGREGCVENVLNMWQVTTSKSRNVDQCSCELTNTSILLVDSYSL